MSIIEITSSSIFTRIVKAVIKGSKKLKLLFIIALLFVMAAIVIAALVDSKLLPEIYTSISGSFGVIAGIFIFGIYGYQINEEETEAKEEIKKVEDKIKENSNETTAAWELGRIKLERYLNRNLTQVQWIFIWTVIVMIAGFIIIGYGIIKVYEGDARLNAAILTTISGLIVEFIGASFLLVYKSTMQQAKDYVTVLERINAVGMSVQILDSISKNETKLQDQTKAEIAKKLLEFYGGVK